MESDRFDVGNLDLIDDDNLASVSPDVCIWLCMLVSVIATKDRLMQATKKLATNPDRKVFVSPFLLTNPEHRTEPQYKEIASFLPNSVVARLEEMVQTECSEDLTFLDALGEVKSVERVKMAFRTWFKKKVKTTKHKPGRSGRSKS